MEPLLKFYPQTTNLQWEGGKNPNQKSGKACDIFYYYYYYFYYYDYYILSNLNPKIFFVEQHRPII